MTVDAILELIARAVLGALATASATEAPLPSPIEQPAPVVTIQPDEAPAGVVPHDQEAVILEDGTILNADGTTACVTASPCDYAANPPPAIETIDPRWDQLAEQQAEAQG